MKNCSKLLQQIVPQMKRRGNHDLLALEHNVAYKGEYPYKLQYSHSSDDGVLVVIVMLYCSRKCE